MVLITGLQAVVINTADMAAARHFYGELLGLELKFHLDDNVSVYSTGNSEICLVAVEPEKSTPGGAAYPNFSIADADATRAELLKRGASCSDVRQDGPVRWFQLTDPDGNRVDCCQHT